MNLAVLMNFPSLRKIYYPRLQSEPYILCLYVQLNHRQQSDRGSTGSHASARPLARPALFLPMRPGSLLGEL